jgi:L-malate glycosyltransferase
VGNIWYVSRTKSGHDRRWTSLLRDDGHRVTELEIDAEVDALRQLAKLSPPEGIVAGPLTDRLPIAVQAGVAPVLGICWGFDVLLEMNDDATRQRAAAALAETSLVHVDCFDLRDRLAAMGVDPDHVSVGAWGIDIEFYTPGTRDAALRAAAGFAEGDIVVLTTRALEPMYAVDVLLEGFAQARQQDPRMRLAWAGTGSLDATLQARSEALGLTTAIHRLGHLDKSSLLAWLRSADVYASASRADGSSLSLMEALACGLPPVVTDLASNREWVSGPDIGTVFPRDDAAALSRALLEVISSTGSPERRREVVISRGDWRENRKVFSAAVNRLLADAR